MRRIAQLGVAVGAATGIALSTGLAVAATTTEVGFGQINQVSQTRSADAETTTSHAFVNLPGGSQLIRTASSGIVLARFSGESACRGSGGWCSVRLLIDGQEMAPQAGSDFAFDAPSAAGYSAHAMDRSAVVQAGTHTVQVQFAAVGAATSIRLDDWTLTLESSAVDH
jgi:hypothetical protein